MQRSFIRVDADELTYPAHILVRYEIERDLMEGRMEPEELPERWNEKMVQYLGLPTFRDGKHDFNNGCLQDSHWMDGSFGYFPTYTLGAMIAAQLRAAMDRDLLAAAQQQSVASLVRSGDLTPIFEWLSEKVWKKASLMSTQEILVQATGEPLNPEFYRRHLEERYI